ncbi:hypothetical protein [Mesorhizobium sp. M2A.F.Ca.ET.039.01.1.1]|uniref:hypothetical protein n=1 Tax=Mesorhizobium sp. M2A.F.Ca.ET.039.01.1.1 TaxID=2496746 RepID=UPI001AECBF5B|nr:hypothetical protein [Mesorhizobium sp. M2A.F.Ca.ET.039.01.1.1]
MSVVEMGSLSFRIYNKVREGLIIGNFVPGEKHRAGRNMDAPKGACNQLREQGTSSVETVARSEAASVVQCLRRDSENEACAAESNGLANCSVMLISRLGCGAVIGCAAFGRLNEALAA